MKQTYVFAFYKDERQTQRGTRDAEKNWQHNQTWLCFLLSPCLVAHVGLLRGSHTPHRGGLIQESVAAGETYVCVCVKVVVSVQHPQLVAVSHTRKP